MRRLLLVRARAPSFVRRALVAGVATSAALFAVTPRADAAAPPPPPPPQPAQPAYVFPPCASGKDAISTLIATFRAASAELARSGRLAPTHLIAAGAATADIYDFLFGRDALLAKILRRTTERHVRLVDAPLRDARTPPEARACVFELLRWELRERGVAYVQGERRSIGHAVLWLQRGLAFIRLFMVLFATEPAARPNDCARRAYDAGLGLYHGAARGRAGERLRAAHRARAPRSPPSLPTPQGSLSSRSRARRCTMRRASGRRSTRSSATCAPTARQRTPS